MVKSPVLCIGELLIDFFCTDIDVNLIEGNHFLKSAGGAPANVAAAIAKLGGEAAFIGKVGQDPFGYFLKQTLDLANVDTSMLVMDKNKTTTLAFVSLKENGERDFVFNRGADAHFSIEDINLDNIKPAAILHFGSATAMLSNPFCGTYFNLLLQAKEEGKFISFDPNFRGDLWKEDINSFISRSKKAIALSDFVKVSHEELELITNTSHYQKGVNRLHELGAKIVTVTLGKEGTFLSNGLSQQIINSISINAVDSTGAGDAFVGAVLYKLSNINYLEKILTDFEQLKSIIVFANKVGALVCTKIGAIAALPSLQEVEEMVIKIP